MSDSAGRPMHGRRGAAQRQAAARAAYLASVEAGTPLTGTALGAQFGRPQTWGAARIGETRGTTTGPHQPGASDADAGTRTRKPVTHNAGLVTSNDGRATSNPEPTTSGTGQERCITSLAVVAVMSVAAVTSYDHQRGLAALAGEGWRAYVLPISVDGLVVAASMTMLTRRRAGHPAGALAWTALLLGLAGSLAANVLAADPGLVNPSLIRRVVAAWPPLALALTWELFLQQLHRPNRP